MPYGCHIKFGHTNELKYLISLQYPDSNLEFKSIL